MDYHLVERALRDFDSVFGPEASSCLHTPTQAKGMTPRECLEQTPVGSLLFRKARLIEVNAKDNLDHVLRRFQAFNVKSAPVFDTAKGEYVGMLSTFDILVFIAFGFFKADDQTITKDLLAERRAHVADMPVETLLGSAEYLESGWWRRNGLYVYEPKESVSEVLSAMMSGVGRVLVRTEATDKKDGMDAGTMHEHRDVDHKVLSETDVLTFLCERSNVFAETFRKKLSELSLDTADADRPIVLVNQGKTALFAFRKMFQERAEAAGVVDCHNKLLAVITASDLRGLRLHNMEDLLLPVQDFLAKKRMGAAQPPLAVGGDATLLATAAVLLMSGVHHVWVVDSKGVPSTIVRTRDILHTVWKESL